MQSGFEERDGNVVFVLYPEKEFAAFMALNSFATFVEDEDSAYKIFNYSTTLDEKYEEQLAPPKKKEENEST